MFILVYHSIWRVARRLSHHNSVLLCFPRFFLPRCKVKQQQQRRFLLFFPPFSYLIIYNKLKGFFFLFLGRWAAILAPSANQRIAPPDLFSFVEIMSVRCEISPAPLVILFVYAQQTRNMNKNKCGCYRGAGDTYLIHHLTVMSSGR